jgi:beta-galactosidase/beta-glucuronidase
MSIPRSEYPRPQFVRKDWMCLNGEWEFDIDADNNGMERGLGQKTLSKRILVPFCPESPLSGIYNEDFMDAVWYRRSCTIPSTWAGNQVLLHFQAVDYDATVWVNDHEVARHRGGFTPFTANLTGIAEPGDDITIVVRARDDRNASQPRGKQSTQPERFGCMYTRTTGIWQTVWMEPVPPAHLGRSRLTPDAAAGIIHLEQPIHGLSSNLFLQAVLKDDGRIVCQKSVAADQCFTPYLDLTIPVAQRKLWGPGHPNLYDLEIELVQSDGNSVDHVDSYAGLRSITIDGKAVKINDETVFQRLVLDQGYYRDGILTAPSDDALVRDITLSMEAGFNGARLHQKIFEERFLYHADRLGYLVWGEFPDWGCSGRGPIEDHQQPTASYITQWLEAINRDYSHPSIVGWCPLNETWQPITDQITTLDDVTQGLFLATKALDRTRPVLDTSGYSHRVAEADIFDSHDYEQNPAIFARTHSGLVDGHPFSNLWDGKAMSLPYHNQPYFVSEFGGIWWQPDASPGEDSWGYGDRPKTLEEYYQRFTSLCAILLDNPLMFGYCYTQLTDVYQEQNGIYSFDRQVKFDLTPIRLAQSRQAAIEKETNAKPG